MDRVLWLILFIVFFLGSAVFLLDTLYWNCEVYNTQMVDRNDSAIAPLGASFKSVPTKLCHPYWYK